MTEERLLELPHFDEDYIDRGYYLVSEFQDEKRRRDRTAAIKLARRHPGYLCLMTDEQRLIHRNVYTHEQLALFRDLHALIATWSSPRYYVMGYEIPVGALLEGLDCYQKMGETCNRLIEDGKDTYPNYLGCPRASVSMRYQHPKAWYRVLYQVTNDSSCAQRLSPQEEGSAAAELIDIARQYSGCPLINVQRLRAAMASLPEEIQIEGKQWHIGEDVLGEVGLQPKSKGVYTKALRKLELEGLPCSDVPTGIEPLAADEEEADDETPRVVSSARRREQLKRFSWLDD